MEWFYWKYHITLIIYYLSGKFKPDWHHKLKSDESANGLFMGTRSVKTCIVYSYHINLSFNPIKMTAFVIALLYTFEIYKIVFF